MSNATQATYAWLKATCGDDSYREIARRAKLSDSIISRQIRDLGTLTFEVAAAIAREYDVPVLGALISNGLLSLTEAGVDSTEAVLSAASDEQLVREIARRLEVADANSIFDKPISEATQEATIHQFPDRNVSRTHDDDRAVARPRDPEPTDEQ